MQQARRVRTHPKQHVDEVLGGYELQGARRRSRVPDDAAHRQDNDILACRNLRNAGLVEEVALDGGQVGMPQRNAGRVARHGKDVVAAIERFANGFRADFAGGTVDDDVERGTGVRGTGGQP